MTTAPISDAEYVRRTVKYILDRDCDFITVDTLCVYTGVPAEEVRAVLLEMGYKPEVIA